MLLQDPGSVWVLCDKLKTPLVIHKESSNDPLGVAMCRAYLKAFKGE